MIQYCVRSSLKKCFSAYWTCPSPFCYRTFIFPRAADMSGGWTWLLLQHAWMWVQSPLGTSIRQYVLAIGLVLFSRHTGWYNFHLVVHNAGRLSKLLGCTVYDVQICLACVGHPSYPTPFRQWRWTVVSSSTIERGYFLAPDGGHPNLCWVCAFRIPQVTWPTSKKTYAVG